MRARSMMLLAVVGSAACGGSSTPVQPPAPSFTPSTVEAVEITGCGDGCDRVGACFEAGWGKPMSDDERASCESDCLTLTPEDGDAWMTAVGAATECAVIVDL